LVARKQTIGPFLKSLFFFQLKARIEELEKDKNTLNHQKEMLQEYHQKQKARADSLETQRKSLQETLANLTETEVVPKTP